MKKKTNQSTMNKIVSGLIGGTILFLILNFIVKPLIEEKKVNKESISEKCGKINLSKKRSRIPANPKIIPSDFKNVIFSFLVKK